MSIVAFQASEAQRITRVLELRPTESVFAYARISPEGNVLAYASQGGDPAHGETLVRTIRVVDLKTKRVAFTEPGIDPYWSPDGSRIVFLSLAEGRSGVSIWHKGTGAVSRNVAPPELGDYFSWAVRGGQDVILTIQGNYYNLRGDKARLPAQSVPSCKVIGRGERPLISKDGRSITTFVLGTIVVRDLDDCKGIVETGIEGAKADFSWDGRYIAFHALKSVGIGYEIRVIDLQKRTVRTISGLPGSSLFPSWTRDSRLCFRYDGPDYRGFVIATDVLAAPASPLHETASRLPARRTWAEMFPETERGSRLFNLVVVWSTWSAHSPQALIDLQRAKKLFDQQSIDVDVSIAAEPASQASDVRQLLTKNGITLRQISIAPSRLYLTEATNQTPVTLLFRDGVLVDRRLGAQSLAQLQSFVFAAQVGR